MFRVISRLLFVVALGTSATSAWAFDALITECHDGDSCTAIADGNRFKIRVHGIDAPEIDQPYGIEARSLMVSLVVRRHVDLTAAGYSYKRRVTDIRLSDGTDVAERMVAAGAAWVEPRYNTDPKTPAMQASAQQRHLGLWANPSAIPPWEWRHGRNQNQAYQQQRPWWWQR